jgi:hypothetical protein
VAPGVGLGIDTADDHFDAHVGPVVLTTPILDAVRGPPGIQLTSAGMPKKLPRVIARPISGLREPQGSAYFLPVPFPQPGRDLSSGLGGSFRQLRRSARGVGDGSAAPSSEPEG